MLINAQTENFKVDDYKETFNDKYDPSRIEKKLTYEVNFESFLSSEHVFFKYMIKEVIMNLILFLNAGFETTSVTLSTLAFILAKHPEEMKKLQVELDTLENVSKNIYLHFIQLLKN